jgi:hypothetical protein
MEKQQLEEIQELLKTVNMKAVEIQLEQMKLDDNTTVIEAEVFEADQPVMIVTEDEQMIPLPVGEYGLEDGRILVVQEEGVIFEVKDAQSEEEVTEPAMEEEVAASEKTVAPVAKKVVESVSKESYFSKASEDDIIEFISKVVDLKLQALQSEVKEEVELSEVKPITHNPENKVEMTINVAKGNGIVDFLNNRK